MGSGGRLVGHSPFDRNDARLRAEMARHAAESYEGALRERRDYGGVSDERARAGHVQIMLRRVEFERGIAEAYERVARGEDP